MRVGAWSGLPIEANCVGMGSDLRHGSRLRGCQALAGVGEAGQKRVLGFEVVSQRLWAICTPGDSGEEKI